MGDTPETNPADQSATSSEFAEPATSTEPARLPTALIYDPAMLDHHVPEEFPDVPERLERGIALIEGLIAEESLPAERVLRLDARLATHDELTTVHTPAYVDQSSPGGRAAA